MMGVAAPLQNLQNPLQTRVDNYLSRAHDSIVSHARSAPCFSGWPLRDGDADRRCFLRSAFHTMRPTSVCFHLLALRADEICGVDAARLVTMWFAAADLKSTAERPPERNQAAAHSKIALFHHATLLGLERYQNMILDAPFLFRWVRDIFDQNNILLGHDAHHTAVIRCGVDHLAHPIGRC